MPRMPPNIISVTGPESCGKTTLTDWLSHKTNAMVISDLSRSYFTHRPFSYNQEDVLAIADNIIAALESARFSHSALVLLDTDLINIKIWLEYNAWTVPDQLIEHIHGYRPSLSLLLSPDIPWSPDPLRKNPDDRHKLFTLFQKNLKAFKYPFHTINGDGDERLQNAWNSIEPFLKTE
jgi:nicotinamide riboside kinase